jgi:hypothetical protein
LSFQKTFSDIYQTNIPPDEVPSLRQAVRWIAKLGGFMGQEMENRESRFYGMVCNAFMIFQKLGFFFTSIHLTHNCG